MEIEYFIPPEEEVWKQVNPYGLEAQSFLEHYPWDQRLRICTEPANILFLSMLLLKLSQPHRQVHQTRRKYRFILRVKLFLNIKCLTDVPGWLWLRCVWQFHEDWIDRCWRWLLSIGLREELMQRSVHLNDKLAHYARACTDVTFQFPFGQQVPEATARLVP